MGLGCRTSLTPWTENAIHPAGFQVRAFCLCRIRPRNRSVGLSQGLNLRIPLTEWLIESLNDLRADCLTLTLEIAAEAYRLPESFHRDPADRQIVACARLHQLTLVTADDRILEWGHVATVDARK